MTLKLQNRFGHSPLSNCPTLVFSVSGLRPETDIKKDGLRSQTVIFHNFGLILSRSQKYKNQLIFSKKIFFDKILKIMLALAHLSWFFNFFLKNIFFVYFIGEIRFSNDFEFLLEFRSHDMPVFWRLRPKVSENEAAGLSGFSFSTLCDELKNVPRPAASFSDTLGLSLRKIEKTWDRKNTKNEKLVENFQIAINKAKNVFS